MDELEELGRRVSAARAAAEARGETFYQGASRVHLAAFPPRERRDDWVELSSRACPAREEKHYTLVPTTCFNCESACGLLAYVDRETGRVRKFEGNPEHPGSRGRNCAKGPATINQVTDPDRILYPRSFPGCTRTSRSSSPPPSRAFPRKRSPRSRTWWRGRGTGSRATRGVRRRRGIWAAGRCRAPCSSSPRCWARSRRPGARSRTPGTSSCRGPSTFPAPWRVAGTVLAAGVSPGAERDVVPAAALPQGRARPAWNESAYFADYVLPMGVASERHDTHSYEQYDGQWIAFRQPVLRAARERRGEKITDTREVNPGEVWEENEFWIELSWRIDPDGSLGIRRYYESVERPGEKLTADEYYGWMFAHSVPGLPEQAAAEGLTPLEWMRRRRAGRAQRTDGHRGHHRPPPGPRPGRGREPAPGAARYLGRRPPAPEGAAHDLLAHVTGRRA